MQDNQANQIPQFSTADYGTSQTGDTCKVCKHPVGRTYYRANNAVVCGRCTDNLKRQLPQDSHAAFVRAILFGVGGFAVGMALYAGFVIATGISIGYLALAVGFIIGKAMMTGSNGVGGRRYQIVAVLLTYAAVSIAYVPILIHFMNKQRTERAAITQKASNNPARNAQVEPSTGNAPVPTSRPNLGAIAGRLALWGLASPFLRLQYGPSAILGLVILAVGMQFAWKMTARNGMVITGPFQSASAASASA
jgi:hypothetical protein